MRKWVAVACLGVAACGYPQPEDVLPPGEVPRIGFEFPNSGADEAVGTLQIPIVLTHPATFDIAIAIDVEENGSAVAARDFQLLTDLVAIPAGATRAFVEVQILPDADDTETAELFTLHIVDTGSTPIDETRAVHEILIADHILPRIEFADAGGGFTEFDDLAMLPIRLTAPAERDTTVVIGIDPRFVDDVGLPNGMLLQIPEGVSSMNVAVGIIDDPTDEFDELVGFELKGASSTLVLGTTTTYKLTIFDDDAPPVVTFDTNTSSVNENAGQAMIGLSLSLPSTKPITVGFSPAGSATNNVDYTTSFEVAFDPGTTKATFVVNIINDTTAEGPEFVNFQLSGCENAICGSGSHTLTINSDE